MKFKPCPGCKTPAKCAKEGCQKEKTGMAKGGMTAKKKDYMSMGMSKGGKVKKMGYNKGGAVACGASNPPARPMK